MAVYQVPSHLIEMLKSKRVIPFIGAGFSVPMGLPDWEELLNRLAKDLNAPIPFVEIKRYCNGNPLQIAEYLYLLSDKSIGPIRHAITSAFRNEKNPLYSTSHVELANLGCPQVYTTNYDDFIENTFKELGIQHEVVILPKHVATAQGSRPQIVKFHGDLRHDHTLVLTESSYYSRLEFEAPMDLKFRSDLLGKSVIFIGYSFQDINIRVIWFKLMEMMKDIRPEDRPTSYIVRLEPNPVLERLYEDVGIKTIVLDPEKKADSPEARSELLSDFLLELSSEAANDDGFIPGTRQRQIASVGLLKRIRATLSESPRTRARRRSPGPRIGSLMSILANREIPAYLKDDIADILLKVSVESSDMHAVARIAVIYAAKFGAHQGVTFVVARSLGCYARDIVIDGSADWSLLWGSKLDESQATKLIDRLGQEIVNHQSGMRDEDLAYLIDVVGRIISGEIYEGGKNELLDRAQALVEDAAKLYPSIAAYHPRPASAPDVQAICDEIEEAQEPEPDISDLL